VVLERTAGLAIATVALPIGVAYPAIAGLPPVVGLYASILPLVGYAIFGSSRQLIVGPDAATLTILAASLSQEVPMAGSEQQRAVVSAAFAIAVGVMCLLSGAFRLGFIANFLSRPILTGYLCGISLSAADQSDRSANHCQCGSQRSASAVNRARRPTDAGPYADISFWHGNSSPLTIAQVVVAARAWSPGRGGCRHIAVLSFQL